MWLEVWLDSIYLNKHQVRRSDYTEVWILFSGGVPQVSSGNKWRLLTRAEHSVSDAFICLFGNQLIEQQQQTTTINNNNNKQQQQTNNNNKQQQQTTTINNQQQQQTTTTNNNNSKQQ